MVAKTTAITNLTDLYGLRRAELSLQLTATKHGMT
jgi:hypothetical protein